jgi:hypothetical protein
MKSIIAEYQINRTITVPFLEIAKLVFAPSTEWIRRAAHANTWMTLGLAALLWSRFDLGK